MAEYVCIDGPLEGRRFTWRRPPRAGQALTVALLDVEHAVLEVDYRVQPVAGRSGSGRLEFVGARDAHLERRGPALAARVLRRAEQGGDGDLPGDGRLGRVARLGRLARPLGRAVRRGADLSAR